MKSLIAKERFDKVFSQIEAAGSAFSGTVHPEESKIRVEMPLIAGKSQYIFDIKKTAEGPREVTLDRNDVFIPNSWGVFLGLRSNTNDQIELLYPFVPVNDGTHPSVFPVAFTNNNAEAVYAGFMQWLIDNNVVISSYPTENFKHIPQTQGAFVLDASDAAVQEGIQLEWDIKDNTSTLLEKITVCGTRDHKISLNFNAANLTFTATSGYTPYLVFYMDGILVKGGCQYVDGTNPWGDAVGRW